MDGDNHKLDLLTEIHTDVKYIKVTLSDHINRDEKINQEFLKPLWEDHQRRIGASKSGKVMAAVTAFVVNATIAGATAYAAVKALVVTMPPKPPM